MKIIFLGSGHFSRECLQHLIKSKHDVVACVCSPDKRGNRGVVSQCAIKQFSLQNDIPVFQFEKFEAEQIAKLHSFNADVMCTAAFGQILPSEVLTLCKFGVLNVHGSLLPKYRGAAPIQWALINGDEITGISIMRTDLKVDSGDVMLQKQLKITNADDAVSLFEKLAILGGEAIVEALNLIVEGKEKFVPQDAAKATHCKKITNQTALINWKKSADEVVNLVRGLTCNGAAVTKLGENHIKIWKSEVVQDINGEEGTVVLCDKKGLVVAAKDNGVKLVELQFPNGKRISAADAVNGGKIRLGEKLR